MGDPVPLVPDPGCSQHNPVERGVLYPGGLTLDAKERDGPVRALGLLPRGLEQGEVVLGPVVCGERLLDERGKENGLLAQLGDDLCLLGQALGHLKR